MFAEPFQFIPSTTLGFTKYGPNGLYNIHSFAGLPLDLNLKNLLATSANHSLTVRTWSSYKSASRLLIKCFLELHVPLILPLTQDHVLTFTAWLINRGLKSSTISSYLAALRQLHLSLASPIPNIRSDLISQILRGKTNLDAISPTYKPKRLPVTPCILRILKVEIQKSPMSKADKRLFWMLCTISFHGSFRMSELLSRKSTSFDPNYTLLNSDISSCNIHVNNSNINIVTVTVKSPKTGNANSIDVIDIFPTCTDLCPVRAFSKWRKCCSVSSPDLPAFRLGSGHSLTSKCLNKQLKIWLSPYLNFNIGYVSGHSFRAGIPSVLGALGFNDHDIKLVGRWSSRAFQTYLKLPRTKRLAMATAIGGLQV